MLWNNNFLKSQLKKSKILKCFSDLSRNKFKIILDFQGLGGLRKNHLFRNSNNHDRLNILN